MGAGLEICSPSSVEIDGTSLALLGDVISTAQPVRAHRPLPPHVLSRIDTELAGQRVFSSNAIEGNSLSLRETIAIMKSGVVGAKKKREALEVRNLSVAIGRVSEWIKSEHACHNETDFLAVHGLILKEIDDHSAGRYRGSGIMIAGAKHQPPDESYVPGMVIHILRELASDQQTPALVRAAWGHWAITRVHPFQDGNGRMARLWQDVVLFQNQLTCALIRVDDRGHYLECLESADDGNLNPLIQLVARRVLSALDIYIAAIRQEEMDQVWLEGLVSESDARHDQANRLAYARWSRRMEQLRWEFEFAASKINQATANVRIQCKAFELADFEKWRSLCAGPGATRTWLMSLEFSAQRKRVRYIFYFGTHFWTDGLDTDDERAEPRACLLASEDLGDGNATPLHHATESPITFREAFVSGDQLVRKRLDTTMQQPAYDRGIEPAIVAQDFVREVILGRMT